VEIDGGLGLQAEAIARVCRARIVKVLHVAMGIDPQIGGTVSALVAAVTGETRLGATVTVLAQTGDISTDDDDRRWASTRRQLVAAGATVHGVSRLSFAPRATAARLGITFQGVTWTYRNVHRFNVVQIHGAWGFLPLMAAICARVHRVPVVLTAHESLTQFGAEGSRSRVRRAIKMCFRPFVRRIATVVVFTSPRERDDSGFSSGARAAILPNGIVLDDRAPAMGRPASETVALAYVGRIHPKKNIDLLLRSIAEDDRTTLAIAGDADTPHGRELRQLAESLGVQDRISWCGFLEPADRRLLVRDVDALVLPSKFENFGMAAAEAMADGTPVIVSPYTGIAAIVDLHGGGLVADTTTSGLRAAFEVVRSGTEPRLGSIHTRAVAERHLSCEAYAESALALYTSVAQPVHLGMGQQ
jgi:glycosyltransferase involved in cell wall biosynthesis